MSHYHLRKSASMLALSLSLGFTASTAFAAEAAPAATASEDSGAIVVTARKREESILMTPVAISAISAESIAKRGINSLNDVIDNTPGINVSNASAGRNDRSFQQIALRGMTPSSATSTLTSAFIDGVPVASATALNTVTDPARLEILKGPQAAYFGRNTFAGAINVVTKTPGKVWGGSFSGTVSSRNGYDLAGAVEGPIVEDVLSFRLSGHAFAKGGSYINAANPNERLGDQKTRNVSLLVAFQPTSKLKFKAFGLYSRDNDGPSAQGFLSAYQLNNNNGVMTVGANSPGTIIVPSLSNCNINGLTAGRAANETLVSRAFFCGALPALPAGYTPAQNTTVNALITKSLSNNQYRVGSLDDSVTGYGLRRKYYHLHLTGDWSVTDDITVSSMTGYNNEYYSELADLDNYDSSSIRNVNNPTNALSTVSTFFDFPFVVERKTRDFSQEVRANYEKNGLRVMLGASYLWTKSESDLVNVSGEILIPGNVRPASTTSAPQQSRNMGVFGAINYPITKQLKLSLEGRLQRDTISLFAAGAGAKIGQAAADKYGIPAGTFGPLAEYFKKSYNNFLPRIILNYEFTPDMMAYASWSKAANISLASFNSTFISGSPTIINAGDSIGLGVIVKPETLTNYEIGVKGRFWEGKGTFSLAAYAAEWNDQQNNRSVFITDEAPPTGTGLPQVVSGLANTGKVLLKGLELDMGLRPVKAITINFSGAINDTNIRSYADPNTSILTGVFGDGFVGKHSPLTSKYSANLGVQYDGSFGSDGKTWFARTDVSYKSKQFLDASNITWIKGRAVVNARLGLKLGSIGVEAFVNNLFNDSNYTTVAPNRILTPSAAVATAPNGAFGYAYVGLPDLRTVGLKASVKY